MLKNISNLITFAHSLFCNWILWLIK